MSGTKIATQPIHFEERFKRLNISLREHAQVLQEFVFFFTFRDFNDSQTTNKRTDISFIVVSMLACSQGYLMHPNVLCIFVDIKICAKRFISYLFVLFLRSQIKISVSIMDCCQHVSMQPWASYALKGSLYFCRHQKMCKQIYLFYFIIISSSSSISTVNWYLNMGVYYHITRHSPLQYNLACETVCKTVMEILG